MSGLKTCIIRNTITRAIGLTTNMEAEKTPSHVRILLMRIKPLTLLTKQTNSITTQKGSSIHR